jgi:alkylation response protein AidB-like acyl-CoA dehydrogenase
MLQRGKPGTLRAAFLGFRRTAMDFEFTPQQEAFRAELRAWLEANLTPDLRADPSGSVIAPDRETFQRRRAFQKKLYEARWIGIWWPPEYGGRGAGLVEQYIYDREYERARAPLLHNHAPINQWGPTLMNWGTPAQKERFLRRMLIGDESWCQGYSEPNAGSDLASLQTRAEDRGDCFVVNGQKIWTSGAQYADWMYMLVRTDPAAPKHRGISCMYLDLRSSGVTVRPLVFINGEHHFNEVFFDNVQVPKENLVGPLHEGWKVAMTTLTYERTAAAGRAHELQLNRLAELARTIEIDGRPAADNDYVRQQVVRLRIEYEAFKYTGLRALTRLLKGLPPGPERSVMKIMGAELNVRINKFVTELAGHHALVDGPTPAVPDGAEVLNRVLMARAHCVSGGTVEIQRNIIGERTLGLPK